MCLLASGLCAPAPARAADSAFVGVLAIALEDGVAKQLGLSEQIKNQLLDVARRREDEATDLVLQIRDLPQAEQTARLAPFVQESERLGLALLSDQQRQMLQRIRISRAGMVTLGEPAVAEQLALTDQQKATVKKLLEERAAGLKGRDQQRGTAQAELERRLAGLLTPSQRAAWEGLASATPPADSQARKVANGASAPGTAPPPPKPSDMPPTGPSPTPSAADKPAGDGKLRFQFRFAPWKDVLDWFASQAGLSLVLDVAPQGTFNYTDPREYTPAEAIDLLNSVLLTKGYTLVRRDRMLLVINLEDGVPPNLVTRVTVEDLDKRGEYELVSCLFPLTKTTPEEVEAEVAKLIGPQGSLVVLLKSRQMLVTETAGKLRTIRTVIQSMENPTAGKSAPVRVFELKSVTADEFLAIARTLLGLPGEQNEMADGSLRIAVDPLQARMFVSGKPEQVERFEEILKLVDLPGSGGRAAGALESPQLEVYAVDAADPTTALDVLRTLLAGLPDVRLTTDPVTGNLIALGRPAEHATIKATLAQLQREAKRVDVIPLRRVDPETAKAAINKLFGGSGDDKHKNAPIVDADSATGQLILRGTENQLAQIRALLEKMGELTAGADPTATGQGNVRVLPFAGRPAREALEQVQLLWPTMRKNQIRVVTPSATIPLLRPSQPRPDALPDPAPAKPPQNKSASQPSRADRWWDYVSAAPQTAWEQTCCLLAGPASWRAASLLCAGAPAADTSKPAAPPAAPRKAGDPADILVSSGPGGIVIASEDREALDDFERLLRTVLEQRRMGPQLPTVFYLRYARAEVAADLLQQVLSGESTESKSSGGGGSLLGDLASTAFGEVGGGLVSGLLGLGGGSSSRAVSSAAVSITPDTRLNALIVHASPRDLETIEELLKVIDQQSSPETVQTAGKPQRIPVFNTSAEEVANVVRQIYASRLAPTAGTPQQPSPEEFIRALRGGRTRDSAKAKAVQEQQKMAIGVDPRSNSLIVSAPEALFQEVKSLVEELDRAGLEVDSAVGVVSIKGTNSRALHQALSAIIGDSLRTTRPPAPQGTTTPGQQGSSRGDTRDPFRQQRMQLFNALQGVGPGAFGPGGGPGTMGRPGFSGRPGR
jgi:type II secretory pathway component GspD/PulD (secretin)